MTYEPDGSVDIEVVVSSPRKGLTRRSFMVDHGSANLLALIIQPASITHLPFPPPAQLPSSVMSPQREMQETSDITLEVVMSNPAPTDDMEVTLIPPPINSSFDVAMTEQPNDAAAIITPEDAGMDDVMVDVSVTINVEAVEVIVEQDEDMLSDHEEDEADRGVGFLFEGDDNMGGMEAAPADAS
ncbi:hypothetical protein FRB95_007543 [Tulasnella sp. JGI-2019a]|nr:hypothetical protein FRB95_007543 [Tulasnella sp. JGI-2019a]